MWGDYIPEQTVIGEIREWIHFQISEYAGVPYQEVPYFSLKLKLPRGNFDEHAGNWTDGTQLPVKLTFRQLTNSPHGVRNFMIEFDLGQIEGGGKKGKEKQLDSGSENEFTTQITKPWQCEPPSSSVLKLKGEVEPPPGMNRYYYPRKYLLAGGVDEEDEQSWEQHCQTESAYNLTLPNGCPLLVDEYTYWPKPGTMKRAICENLPVAYSVTVNSAVDLKLCACPYSAISQIEKNYRHCKVTPTQISFLSLLELKIESLIRPNDNHQAGKLPVKIDCKEGNGVGPGLTSRHVTALQIAAYETYESLTVIVPASMKELYEQLRESNRLTALRTLGFDSHRAVQLVSWIRMYLLRVEAQPTDMQETRGNLERLEQDTVSWEQAQSTTASNCAKEGGSSTSTADLPQATGHHENTSGKENVEEDLAYSSDDSDESSNSDTGTQLEQKSSAPPSAPTKTTTAPPPLGSPNIFVKEGKEVLNDNDFPPSFFTSSSQIDQVQNYDATPTPAELIGYRGNGTYINKNGLINSTRTILPIGQIA